MRLPEPSAGSFEICPAGNHLATCYEVLDLGTQDVIYEGVAKKPHQLYIGWEVPNETMDDGRPYVVGRKYTFSMHEKSKMRQHLESWRGRPFTAEDYESFKMENLIGASCFLNVVHAQSGEKTYANIEAVAQLPKGQKPPGLVNAPLFVALAKGEFDQDAFNRVSEYFQNLIKGSPEYAELVGSGPQDLVTVPDEPSGYDETVPF